MSDNTKEALKITGIVLGSALLAAGVAVGVTYLITSNRDGGSDVDNTSTLAGLGMDYSPLPDTMR